MSNGVLGSSANFLPVEPVIGFSVQPLDRHFGPRRSRECKNNIGDLKPAAGVLEAGFLYILSFFPGQVGCFATDYFLGTRRWTQWQLPRSAQASNGLERLEAAR